jgi:hypothetical protein
VVTRTSIARRDDRISFAADAGRHIVAYHQQVMETSRLVLVVVGDIDANQLKPRIRCIVGHTSARRL